MDHFLSGRVSRRSTARFGITLFRRESGGDILVLPEPLTQPLPDPPQRSSPPPRPPRPPRRFPHPDWARIRRLALRVLLIGGVIAGVVYGERWMVTASAASDHYQQGRADYLQGDWRGAVAEATEQLRLDPTDMNGLFLRSSAYFKLKEFRLSARDYRSQIALTSTGDPQDQAVNYQNLAYAEDYYGDHQQAIKDFTEAITLDASIPDQPGWTADAHDDTGDSHKGRMWAYYESGQYPLALADCQALIARDPYPSSIAVRGKIYRHMGDYASAVRDFRTALRENSSLGFASDQLQEVLGQMHQFSQAAAVAEDAARVHPSEAVVWWQVGWWEYRAGQEAMAVAADEKALALDKSLTSVRYNLGLTYAAHGDWAKAQPVFAQALRVSSAQERRYAVEDVQTALLEQPHSAALHQTLVMLHGSSMPLRIK